MLALGGCPHRGHAVGINLGDGGLWFDVALMRRYRWSCRPPPKPPRAAIAASTLPRSITVREHTLDGACDGCSRPLVTTRAWITGAPGARAASMSHHRRQRLVDNIDQVECRLRRYGHRRCRHDGDRLADPKHLVARDVDLRDHPHVVARLAHRDRRADRHIVKVGRRDHRLDAGQCDAARVVSIADDLGVWVRAAQRLGMEHAGQRHVGRIDRGAFDPFAGIDTGETFADDAIPSPTSRSRRYRS